MTHTKGVISVISCILVVALFGGIPVEGFPDQRLPEHWARTVLEKPERTVLQEYHRRDLIYVKFLDASSIRLVEGRFVSDDGYEDEEIQSRTAFLSMASAVIEPMTNETPERLQEYRVTAMRNLGREVADLSKWFVVRVPEPVNAADWIDALNNINLVEIALPATVPAPPPDWNHCKTSSCVSEQEYLTSPSSAPRGVNAQAVWSQYGVAGGGVRIANVEYAYVPHDDFPTITSPLGNNPAHQYADHGTNTFGILTSINNSFGTTGIAHGSTPYFSAYDSDLPCKAIVEAMDVLDPGDVITVPLQAEGPGGIGAYVPLEWEYPFYECVVTAVGNGYVVVSAAGNGYEDLDDSAFDTGHKPFLPQNDSGAIIVGAGWPTPGLVDT